MFLLDDFLLATVIACIVLLFTNITSLLIVLVGAGVGAGAGIGVGLAGSGMGDYIGDYIGGAKKENLHKKEKKNLHKKEKKEKKPILKKPSLKKPSLKEPTNRKIITDSKSKKKGKYYYVPHNKQRMKEIEFYLNRAKYLYKQEKGNLSIFDADSKIYNGTYEMEEVTVDDKLPNIKALMHKRILDDDYTETYKVATIHYGIRNITYFPINQDDFKKKMNKVFDYTIIETIRPLKANEQKELNSIIYEFNTGKLTKPEHQVNFYDGTSKMVNNCNVKSLDRPYSNIYKKLHWGQRKLLLSEIDFFNRVALDIGRDKFKNNKMSFVYPGSAHGHHLLIEMEMYPNLILYLWDPAKYIKILYIIEFMRRKLPITFLYSDEEMHEAKKYEGRVFINMELTNKEFIIYHKNATTNIEENYKTEYGFFTKKSADAYLKHKKQQKDTSVTLFCSDIRLFTNMTAADFLHANNIKDISDLTPIKVVEEHGRHANFIRDMNLQQDWVGFVEAEYSLLKFKLKSREYSEELTQYEYLDGDIILQAWAPVSSTETRLYICPKHNKKSFYNIEKYTDMLKTFNRFLRPYDMSKVKLKDIGMNLRELTIHDIWKHFLPDNLIGMDAVLETYILYDYLYLFKDEVSEKDLILIISDITQTCLEPGNVEGIGEYLNPISNKQTPNPRFDEIMDKRQRFHDGFMYRLDYHSQRTDKMMCSKFSNKPSFKLTK